MRVKNIPVNVREFVALTLPRSKSQPIELRVTALSLGWRRDYDSIVPRPRPPTRTIKGQDPKPVYDDPQFEAAFAQYQELLAYYITYLALKDDANVTWECLPAGTVIANQQQLEAFRDELKQSGLSDGDLVAINEAARRAGNISDSDVKEAQANF